ncbi:hypothetical protein AC56_2890 [Escherichia coli 1-182-04_S3_C3]|nr:hypothetical protein AC56_2890 [Escherichia coli 1-182-04_S3_C3]EZJ92964.1 hypothetical protein AB99_2835 [Escherichia coli 1-182-04_S3_C1]
MIRRQRNLSEACKKAGITDLAWHRYWEEIKQPELSKSAWN